MLFRSEGRNPGYSFQDLRLFHLAVLERERWRDDGRELPSRIQHSLAHIRGHLAEALAEGGIRAV